MEKGHKGENSFCLDSIDIPFNSHEINCQLIVLVVFSTILAHRLQKEFKGSKYVAEEMKNIVIVKWKDTIKIIKFVYV